MVPAEDNPSQPKQTSFLYTRTFLWALRSHNASSTQLDWLAGLRCLFNHSIILVDDPSLRKELAFAATALSCVAADLDGDVDRSWTNYCSVARCRTVLEPVGLDASWVSFRRRILALFAIGETFQRKATRGFPELMPGVHEQRLITTGIHCRIRHPVYLAHLCEMLAWSIGTGLAICYFLTVFALLSGAVMIRFEDKELEKRFGFRRYDSSVPAVFPRLPRSLRR